MAETATQVIGKYEILEKLGEGGFGIVYKANDTSLDRIVAIKQLKVELSSSPEYLERFKREARLMGSLNHPNIVKMLEVFEDAGRYFIVMDYMPNGSLADKLKDGKPLTLERTVEILNPIAKAIDYAHSKNLIHRDIKPSDILFMEGDEPVLSDFGLVKSMESTGLTTTGVAFGTPEYMSPEQILGKELTPATDLYALGIISFQMLTGEVPFKGNTPFEIQEGHVHKEIPDVVKINLSLPKEISKITNRILAKTVAERYTSAKDFVRDLDVVIDQQIINQNQEKFSQVQKNIRNKEFSKASILLHELITIKYSDELAQMLEDCNHKQKKMEEYKNLENQAIEINGKLTILEKKEPWIKSDPKDDILPNTSSIPSIEEKTEKPINWRLLVWLSGLLLVICITTAIINLNNLAYVLFFSMVVETIFFAISLKD
jgi:serine/threonine-protein kinase